MSRHESEVQIANEHGLHARPATKFVQLANQFRSTVKVSKGKLTVDGKSVMSMLRLGATKGTVLRIQAKGQDAEQAVAELVGLVAGRFHEEEWTGAEAGGGVSKDMEAPPLVGGVAGMDVPVPPLAGGTRDQDAQALPPAGEPAGF